MGALLSSLGLKAYRSKAQELKLPDNPILWTDAQVHDAAKIMFEAYDADYSKTIDKKELNKLFDDCGMYLADFGTSNLDFSLLLQNLLKKFDKDQSDALSFDEFLPLFGDMVGRMAEEGFVEKRGLPKFQQAIKSAIAQTHVLIVSLDYKYDPTLELTAIIDGQNIEKLARDSGVTDVTQLFDNHEFNNGSFPLRRNIRRQLQAIGKRCNANDLFVFFYSGHGLNVPDENGDEADGEDEAFAVPNKKGELDIDNILVDDDFALYLDRYIPKSTRILCITDCCHSGSICDIDSFNYKHEIVQISAAKDNQTSLDMSTFGTAGGVLTCAIFDAIKEFRRQGKTQLSVADVYNSCVGKVAKHAKRAKHQQDIGIQHANILPHEFPWPFMTLN
eukprot:GEMP01006547.1.p1 GENE.GEMP01006547.1~~GEMP01006547.1.p1  ORF type:complete len:389 (+),score=78.80 GEMP01006547.1:41-1207(+)